MTGLFERDLFLNELNKILENVLAGQGQIALISGEAGIGKTTLVDYFTRMHKDTVRTLWGTCDSLFTPRPLGPLHDIALEWKGELYELLNSDGDRQNIFSACLIELQRNSTMLIFEDIHWADEATLDLIKFLGRRIQRSTSLLILTYRDDELSTNHPLWSVLGDLPHAITSRLQLSHLSKSSVFALASAAEQAERTQELFEVTNGNPFFVTEILANKGVGMPSTIRDAVLARAARLSPPARMLLEIAAVIGLRSEPWLLAAIADEDFKATAECVSGGMLQSQADFYAFRHELARQTILETISPERKLALHRMALTALKESSLTCNDFARLANHAEGTKDASAVLEFAPAAARQASAASAHREAIALYELALQFVDTLPPVKNAQILEAYSIELWFASRLVESIDILKKAIRLRHSIGDYLREGDNLVPLAEASFLLGRKTEAEQASKSAIQILETLSPSAELARGQLPREVPINRSVLSARKTETVRMQLFGVKRLLPWRSALGILKQ